MNVFDRLDKLPAFNAEELAVLESVGALCREKIAPRAAHYDRGAEFPWDNVKAINALGLNAMFIPEAYGGSPLSYAAYLACVREISKACASTGIIWAIPMRCWRHVSSWGGDPLCWRVVRPGRLDDSVFHKWNQSFQIQSFIAPPILSTIRNHFGVSGYPGGNPGGNAGGRRSAPDST